MEAVRYCNDRQIVGAERKALHAHLLFTTVTCLLRTQHLGSPTPTVFLVTTRKAVLNKAMMHVVVVANPEVNERTHSTSRS